MNRIVALAASIFLVGSGAPAFADTNTSRFGPFFRQDGAQRPARYGNEDGRAGRGVEIYAMASTASIDPASMPVFYLLSAGDLPLDLSTPQDAGLSVDFASTDSGGRAGILGSGSIIALRATPVGEGRDARTNLLTVTFANAELDTSQNGGSFTFKSNDDFAITYTSDFLDFSKAVSEDFSFSFSGASPKFSAVQGNLGVSTRFSSAGTFASDSMPLANGVPAASIWTTLFLSFGAVGVMMRTGRRQRDLYAA